jgi:hypothetical protein
MAARTKLVPLHLPGDVYARLQREALKAERDPIQHARWLLKRSLEQECTDRPPAAPAGHPALETGDAR